MPQHPWPVLGIEPTADENSIRSAFTSRLKAIGTDASPDAIETLVNARDRAIELAKAGRASDASKTFQGGNWRKAHLVFLALFMAAVIGALAFAKYTGALRPIQVDDQLKYPTPDSPVEGN